MKVRKQNRAGRARQLGAYLTAGVGAIAGVSDAQGATIYTPGPFVANNSTIDIDFDGVNGAEFQITHASGSVASIPFNLLTVTLGPDGGGDKGVVGFNGLVPKPERLASGSNISSGANFVSTWAPSNLAGLANPFGSWNGGATGFLGVRFDLGSGTRYGWIELQAPASGLGLNTGQVLGYAYEDTGAAIEAGDMGDVSAVPEPSTLLLLTSGALGVLALKRRKQQ